MSKKAKRGPLDGGAAARVRHGDAELARRHFALGWATVLFFVLLGSVLEIMHAVKVDYYLNVANQTRRLMWTLAHAHGALIGLLHLGLAATLRALTAWPEGSRKLASRCLDGATLLLPGGFLLGGVFIHAGDPGLAILLVPVGAILLVVTTFLATRAALAEKPDADRP